MHEHLPILRCPITRSSLRQIAPDELEALNARIRDGRARTVSGARVDREVGDVVVPASGGYAYPVEDGVYLLLADHAISMGSDPSSEVASPSLNDAKERVRGFYEHVGWKHSETGFMDATLFEDLRPVSEDYRHRCNRRVTKHLPDGGRYLLDAASGPIQYQDYLDFSAGYEVRVCVDFSMTALREVKQRLGDRALCLLADVTELPLENGSVDAVVSLHTIYHLPPSEQATAFLELYRVIAPGGTVVVVYTWPRSVTVRLVHAPISLAYLWRKSLRAMRRPSRPAVHLEEEPAGTGLYFRPQGRQWFVRQQWPFDYKIFTWRSVGVGALRFYFSDSARGKRRLERLERLEDRFPELFGRWGLYPLIVISGARHGRNRPVAPPG